MNPPAVTTLPSKCLTCRNLVKGITTEIECKRVTTSWPLFSLPLLSGPNILSTRACACVRQSSDQHLPSAPGIVLPLESDPGITYVNPGPYTQGLPRPFFDDWKEKEEIIKSETNWDYWLRAIVSSFRTSITTLVLLTMECSSVNDGTAAAQRAER